MKENVVIVDDDLSLRELLESILRREGYNVTAYSNGKEALQAIEPCVSELDLVVTDLMMPEMDGIALIGKIKKLNPDLPVIVITADMKTASTVEALREGAYDYITKPFENDELKIIVKNAIEKRNLLRENMELKSFIKKGEDSIIFKSKAMEELYFKAVSVGKTTVPVLLTGESGTGKELFARLIHKESDRAGQPFFAINCAAIPENLMESEFFGYERGAFTGATLSKPGYFELAHNGTLFLDEIGEIPASMQVKLLRALDDKTILRLGGKESVIVDVRIIAATNKNIEDEVKGGRFREDLYYRLNVIKLSLPPLRERREDIVPLCMHFLRKFCISSGRKIKGFTKDAIKFLEDYSWQGNVRELQNIIERSCVFETGDIVGVGSLPMELIKSAGEDKKNEMEISSMPEPDFSSFSLDVYLSDIEKTIIEKAMKAADNNKKRAAELLGISLWALYHRLDKDKKHDGK